MEYDLNTPATVHWIPEIAPTGAVKGGTVQRFDRLEQAVNFVARLPVSVTAWIATDTNQRIERDEIERLHSRVSQV